MNMTKALILQSKEQLLTDYIKEQHNQDECSGFIDGMEAVIKLLDEMDKQPQSYWDDLKSFILRQKNF